MKSLPVPVKATLNRLLRYDMATGVLTYRRWKRQAGTIDRWGYRRVWILGKHYKAHRLIWMMVTGQQPPDDIDHANMDRDDNRWANLRPADKAKNTRNTRARPSISGLKGAFWHKRRNSWHSKIVVNGAQIFLGYFPSAQDAHAAYCAAADKHFGAFARHN